MMSDDEHENAEGADDVVEEFAESRQIHILSLSTANVARKVANSVSFQKIIDIVRSNSEDKNFTKRDLRSLQTVHSKIQNSLEEVMKSDINNYIDNSGINKAHEAISKISSQSSTSSSSSSSSWRPTGDPRQDMRSHEAENEIQFNKGLQETVQELEAQNQYLMQQISHKRLVLENVKKELLVLKKDCSAMRTSELAVVEQFVDVIKMQSREVD